MYALSTIMAYIATAKDRRDEKGATAVEYGLLVALIAALLVVAAGLLKDDIVAAFGTAGSAIN